MQLNKEYIPVRECEYEISDGIVTVIFDKFEKSWLDKLIKPKKEKIAKIELDDIGSFVWQNCDGKNNISDIIQLTEGKFSDKDKISERVQLFLTQLESKKLIRFYTIN